MDSRERYLNIIRIGKRSERERARERERERERWIGKRNA